MYYEDLTLYTYSNTDIEMKNIAWLETGHDYKKGEVSKEFKDKLWKYMRYPVKVARGFQVCPLCSSVKRDVPTTTFNGETRNVGYYELRVWGQNNTVYAVTSLIFHYMEAHQYEPPKEFIEAVMCSDDPNNQDYYNRVLSLEHGYSFWLEADRTIIE